MLLTSILLKVWGQEQFYIRKGVEVIILVNPAAIPVSWSKSTYQPAVHVDTSLLAPGAQGPAS